MYDIILVQTLLVQRLDVSTSYPLFIFLLILETRKTTLKFNVVFLASYGTI